MNRRTMRLGGRTMRIGMVAGLILLAILIGIAWRAQSAGWFLLFPVLLLGVLAAIALGVLAALRHV
ncbi:MAG TPA: hypothetical protein VGR24_08265 [bacterium]|jgi:hypothetical protein|nr:hypothetical protein [bacterium]